MGCKRWDDFGGYGYDKLSYCMNKTQSNGPIKQQSTGCK